VSDHRDTVTAGLRESRKYSHVCPDALARVAEWALARHPTPKAALKAAKRKLHQVYGAYLGQPDLRRLEGVVAGLGPDADPAQVEPACREALAAHASTAERLPIIERLYADLWSVTGVPQAVADLACGLNPFALPWMGLPADATYHPCDLDEQLMGLVNAFLVRIGRPAVATCRDILVSPPREPAEVALLLKTAPCLEQQEPGATLRLLRQLPARWMVVSFPAQTLGGRQKGMREHYGQFIEAVAGQLAVPMRALSYPTEMVYVLETAWRGEVPQGQPDNTQPAPRGPSAVGR